MKRLFALFVLLLGCSASHAACTGTALTVGMNVPATVAAAASGTTFCFSAGTFRLTAPIVPKINDVFTGASTSTTFVTGALLVTGWTVSGTNWFASVPYTYTGHNCSNAGGCVCLTGVPACQLEEDLFSDNTVYQRQAALGTVGPGKWYWDEAAGKIYIGSDPTGHTIEVSVVTDGFQYAAGLNTVTVQDMTVEKFTGSGVRGRITGSSGSGWTVQRNNIRFNHLAGISVSTTMQVLSNTICDNGKLGGAGGGNTALVQNNEICRNNYAGYSSNRGGMKLEGADGITYRTNYVHDNIGSGLHTDSGSTNTLYDQNHFVNNQNAGINYEISHSGIIQNNVFENEVQNITGTSCTQGAAIFIQASDGIEVKGNTITGAKNGICGYQALRNDNLGNHYIQNLNVHDNTVTQSSGLAAGIFSVTDPSVYPAIFTSWNNKFTTDNYCILPASGNFFQWNGSLMDATTWKSSGLDTSGVFVCPSCG